MKIQKSRRKICEVFERCQRNLEGISRKRMKNLR